MARALRLFQGDDSAGAHSERRRSVFRSLQFKASLLVMLLILILAIAGNAMALRALGSVLYANEFDRAREWAVSLASGASTPLQRGETANLQRAADDLMRTARVEYVAFADASGEILASRESSIGLLDSLLLPDGQAERVEPPHAPRLIQHPTLPLSCLDVVVPIYSAERDQVSGQPVDAIIGYVRLAVDITDTTRKLALTATRLWRAGVIVVLLVLPFSLLVTVYVVSPLNELARTARAIASGSMDERANISSGDEIGELASWFNTMADRVASSQFDLLQLNAQLEGRVEERTRELEDLASRDPLTGLYNRRYFGEVITREFARAERYDTDLTCLMFDVDHFKETNDQFGHRTGDEVLIILAAAISKELRESDVAARFGGDEFILLLPQTAAVAAATLADRIVATFNHAVRQKFPGVPATLSIGVASLRTTRSRSSEALIHEADLALYAAKEGGRNRTVEAAPAAI